MTKFRFFWKFFFSTAYSWRIFFWFILFVISPIWYFAKIHGNVSKTHSYEIHSKHISYNEGKDVYHFNVCKDDEMKTIDISEEDFVNFQINDFYQRDEITDITGFSFIVLFFLTVVVIAMNYDFEPYEYFKK